MKRWNIFCPPLCNNCAPVNSDTHCLQTSLLIFKFCQPQNKESFVSTVNKPLVGTLMTIGDVTVSIAMVSPSVCVWGGGGGERESGIPTGFDIKLPPLGWEFDKSVLPQGLEDCQH